MQKWQQHHGGVVNAALGGGARDRPQQGWPGALPGGRAGFDPADGCGIWPAGQLARRCAVCRSDRPGAADPHHLPCGILRWRRSEVGSYGCPERLCQPDLPRVAGRLLQPRWNDRGLCDHHQSGPNPHGPGPGSFLHPLPHCDVMPRKGPRSVDLSGTWCPLTTPSEHWAC